MLLESSPDEQGLPSKKLQRVLERISTKDYAIDSLSIVVNGHLVVDECFFPFRMDEFHSIQSCTKSILSLLIGILIDKGWVRSVDTPISEFFPEGYFYKDPIKRAITLRHLLTLTSGLRDLHGQNREVQEIQHSADWVDFVLNLPVATQPGSHFEYRHGGTHLLSAVIQKVSGMNALEFARQYLFDPLGLGEVHWETDPQGVCAGFTHISMRPGDFVRIGALIANQGRWDDRQVVSDSWLQASFSDVQDTGGLDGYGYLWWVSRGGYVFSKGRRGQYLFISRENRLAVAITADLSLNNEGVPRRLFSQIQAMLDPGRRSKNEIAYRHLVSVMRRMNDEKPQGMVWSSAPEGVAHGGVFERAARPAFRFQYGHQCRQLSVDPPRIMALKRLDGDGGVEISIESDVDRNIDPTLRIEERLRDVGVEFVRMAKRKIYLRDGTLASAIEVNWKYEGILETDTVVLIVDRGTDRITICIDSANRCNFLKDILDSLTFRDSAENAL